MTYKLVVTKHTADLLDGLLEHLLYRLRSRQAAQHLLRCVEETIERIKENPHQFPASRDRYLAKSGYHEAVTGDMHYVVIFNISDDTVTVAGIFHQLEDYPSKL